MHRLAVLPALLFTALFCARADSVLVFNEIQYHPVAGETDGSNCGACKESMSISRDGASKAA
jgi:hypothetical protein